MSEKQFRHTLVVGPAINEALHQLADENGSGLLDVFKTAIKTLLVLDRMVKAGREIIIRNGADEEPFVITYRKSSTIEDWLAGEDDDG